MVTVTDLEWDNYSLLLPINSSVDYAGSWPLNPISVLPGSNTSIAMVVAAASQNSLLLQLMNETQSPIAAATVELIGNSLISTNSAGLAPNGDQSQVFFGSLAVGNYSLTISSPEYATVSASLNVVGDKVEIYTLATQSATP